MRLSFGILAAVVAATVSGCSVSVGGPVPRHAVSEREYELGEVSGVPTTGRKVSRTVGSGLDGRDRELLGSGQVTETQFGGRGGFAAGSTSGADYR